MPVRAGLILNSCDLFVTLTFWVTLVKIRITELRAIEHLFNADLTASSRWIKILFAFEEFHDGLGARLDIQLLIHRMQIRPHGAQRDAKLVGDLPAKIPLAQRGEDFVLAFLEQVTTGSLAGESKIKSLSL